MRRRKKANFSSALRMGQAGSRPEEVYQLLDEIPLTATLTGSYSIKSAQLVNYKACVIDITRALKIQQNVLFTNNLVYQKLVSRLFSYVCNY
jgi:hypothetical protein